MYRLMIYYLSTLLLGAVILSGFGILPYVWWQILLSFALLWLICALVNSAFAALFRTQAHHESELITALILSSIIGPLNPLVGSGLIFLAAVAAISQASKYLLAYRKKHLFNPAGLAVLTSAVFLNQNASWWIGDRHLLPIMLIGGFLILRKLRWFHLSLSFLIVYTLGSIGLYGGRLDFISLLSPLIFFGTVMLIEPQTAPSGKLRRMLYGASIAALLLLITKFTSWPYTLELALITGNFAFWWTKTKRKITLKFLRREQAAEKIYKFVFEPLTSFRFMPGQFLEWTLPHPNADTRGVRRWFTISASPTEKEIFLTTKIIDHRSTFKQALFDLPAGTEIMTSDPDGDFILPKNTATKLAFIAGGIGITPFRSMVKFLLDKDQKRDIVLLYTAKYKAEFCFQDLFEQARSVGLNTFYLETEKTGFITTELIKNKITDWDSRTFYISGPEPMVEAYQKMLKQTGIKDAGIKTDFFPGYEVI